MFSYSKILAAAGTGEKPVNFPRKSDLARTAASIFKSWQKKLQPNKAHLLL